MCETSRKILESRPPAWKPWPRDILRTELIEIVHELYIITSIKLGMYLDGESLGSAICFLASLSHRFFVSLSINYHDCTPLSPLFVDKLQNITSMANCASKRINARKSSVSSNAYREVVGNFLPNDTHRRARKHIMELPVSPTLGLPYIYYLSTSRDHPSC